MASILPTDESKGSRAEGVTKNALPKKPSRAPAIATCSNSDELDVVLGQEESIEDEVDEEDTQAEQGRARTLAR